MSRWFEADKVGLRQIAERLVERRGFGILGAELYQNVMDTSATLCAITLEKSGSRGWYALSCEDNDPTGFANLSHAYTVFAPSLKKHDAEKAGRFNLGEKIVLAFCHEARIETTRGTVVFDATGREEQPRRRRKVGTKFGALIECTPERCDEFLAHLRRILVKPGLTLTVNGDLVPAQKPIAVFEETLLTEHGDNLKSTKRKCAVEIYQPQDGQAAMLYELGIPVVETGDKWHYSVRQKVPLNAERDNVPAAYLRDLRAFVFNHMHEHVTSEDTEEFWISDATSDKKVTNAALADFKTKKFGANAVAEDPFNRDANAAALTHGRTVIPKHGLSKGQRENLKERGLLISSTQAFPTAGKGAYSNDPNAASVNVIPESEWSAGMRAIFVYTQGMAKRLIDKSLIIRFVDWPHREGGTWRACYGAGHVLGLSFFDYNVGVLGKRWFDNGVIEDTDSLILHELGHEFCTNHADENYYRALTRLGARLKAAALAEPEWFRGFEKRDNAG